MQNLVFSDTNSKRYVMPHFVKIHPHDVITSEYIL